jgi:hypothetical protein
LDECEDDALNNRDCNEKDLDLKLGCNQMFSCAHACAMRHMGIDKDTCFNKCNRTGSSGCSPKVSLDEEDEDNEGCKFSLCGPCNRDGCSSRYPDISECELGCESYGMWIKKEITTYTMY